MARPEGNSGSERIHELSELLEQAGAGPFRIEVGGPLVLFTDGLVDARAPDRRFYGVDRLIEVATEAGR